MNGARWVMKDVLSRPAARQLAVFTVWVPALRNDRRGAASKSQEVIRDKRVVQRWDEGGVASRWFLSQAGRNNPAIKAHRLFRRGFVWDAYFLYDAKTTWGKPLGKPVAWGGPIVRAKAALLKQFGTKVEGKKEEKKKPAGRKTVDIKLLVTGMT